jgi:hypothetical protein
MVQGQCQCSNSSLVLRNGICEQPLACPANSYFHLETYCCLCLQNYRLVEGACLPFSCGPHSHSYNGICICDSGYFLINNQCSACGQN